MTFDEYKARHSDRLARLAWELVNKSSHILKQPIHEPWRDRLERYLDDRITRHQVRLMNDGTVPLWLKGYRLVRRSYLYRRFILEQL